MSGPLGRTAQQLVAPGKGILAADESTATIGKRFASVGVECTPENRRAYRELLITAPGIEEHISGVILYDETIRQATSDGRPFVAVLEEREILPGIKVDTGAKPLAGAPGETVTEGLDGLRARLAEYRELGARFAKWRAVIEIGDDGCPSAYCIHVNAHALGRYAALCHDAGLLPIVEPEILMEGSHGIERSADVTEIVLRCVFGELASHGVALETVLLKTNMVLSGTTSQRQAGSEEVARATLTVLRRAVPAAVPGIVFLSGGQSDEGATVNLNALNQNGAHPWVLSFSYGRALHARALSIWRGVDGNTAIAQQALHERARSTSAAQRGEYTGDTAGVPTGLDATVGQVTTRS